MDSFRNFLNKFKSNGKASSQPANREVDEYALESCEAVIYQHVNGTAKASARALIDSLKMMEEFGNPAHVYAATQLCSYYDDGVRKQSWKTIEALLRDVPVHMLPSISLHMRRQGVNVEPTFRGIERDMPLKVIGMLSFNRSGFIREVALKELATMFNGKELPFLIIAANDWVANIHVLATDALERRANKQYAPYLVENLSLLRRLWRSGRHQFGRLQTDVESLAAADIGAKDLPGLFSTDPERQLWQYAFNLCIEAQEKSAEEIDELIKFGLNYRDMRIQQIAAGKVLKQYAPETLRQYVPILLQHHLPQIRREALRWVVKNEWDDYKNTLHQCLFDRSMSVRLLAQYHMDKSKALPIYEENLRVKKYSLEANLRGLYEIKADIDQNTIESFLSHSSGKIRAAAYALLFQEKPADLQQIVMRALADASSCCAKEAFKFLQGNRELLSAEELWELLNSSISVRGKKTTISAMARLGKWQGLEYLFLAKTVISPELQEYADHYLNDWGRTYNQSFIKLSREQHERCKSALAKCESLMTEKRRHSFEHLLKNNLEIS